MQIGKKIVNYINTSDNLNFNCLYICSKSNSYLKYSKDSLTYDKNSSILSLKLKSLLKRTNDFFIVNCFEYPIFDNDSNIAKSIIIIKIDSNRFAVYTNEIGFYNESDVNSFLEFSKGFRQYIIR